MAMTEVTEWLIVASPVTEVIAPSFGAHYPVNVDSKGEMNSWQPSRPK